jgi:hypothetical protein
MPVLVEPKAADIPTSSYRWQLSQLAELQLEQELPPTGVLKPLLSLEKEAKGESTRLARL